MYEFQLILEDIFMDMNELTIIFYFFYSAILLKIFGKRIF
jgi:hypothetical protein